MKKRIIFYFLMACVVFAGCSKDEDKVHEQEVVISSHILNEDGNMVNDEFRFIFVPSFSFVLNIYDIPCTTYEEYIKFEEDSIYTWLADYGSPNVKILPSEPFIFIDNQTKYNKPMRVKLPVGTYHVFALPDKRRDDKKIWNKYGFLFNLQITKKKKPIVIKCVLPVNYTFIGGVRMS